MIHNTHNIITGSQYTFEPIKENRYFKRLKAIYKDFDNYSNVGNYKNKIQCQ